MLDNHEMTKEDRQNINDLIVHFQQVLKKKNRCIIAIDGKSAAGKSTLASYLQNELDASVIHMDDFFLPPELRTKERYLTPGGNVHYERFHQEVTEMLLEKRSFSYQRFNCKKMQLDTWQEVQDKKVIIVEGAYATHPKIRIPYDVKLFLDINPMEQEKRICSRNGEVALQQFISKWIPLEEEYIKTYEIQKNCDYIWDMGILDS